ncbi:Ig-like domain-containing protein [Acerihabitans arboris]|uniref:Uncharacterized protein n=1 Tax=Acerihabitans arboris TaxID=2691583 RepID=A0A845SM79_9GAMM|nr:Ig-like domain-containing protein [Acerihabitans arboris]NDL63678.1 hypothetical protein [Acerihabitans arboris]
MQKHNIITVISSPKAKYHNPCDPCEGPRDPCERPQDYDETPKDDTSILTAVVTDCATGVPVPCVTVKFSCDNPHAKIKHNAVKTNEAGVAETEVTYPHIIYPLIPDYKPIFFTADIPGDSASVAPAPVAIRFPPIQLINATPITGTDNYTINAGQIAAGPAALVFFPDNDSLGGNQDGDRVSFYWRPGTTPFQKFRSQVPNGQFVVDLSSALFKPNETFSNGAHDFFITFAEGTNLGSAVSSPGQIATVSGSQLSPPTLPQPDWLPLAAWVFNVEFLAAGIFITIPNTVTLATGDLLSIFVDVFTAGQNPVLYKTITVVNGATAILPTGFPLTAADFDGLNGYVGRIRYQIQRAAGGLETSATRGVSIDTVPPGGVLELEDDYCGCRDEYNHDYDHNPRKSRY